MLKPTDSEPQIIIYEHTFIATGSHTRIHTHTQSSCHLQAQINTCTGVSITDYNHLILLLPQNIIFIYESRDFVD